MASGELSLTIATVKSDLQSACIDCAIQGAVFQSHSRLHDVRFPKHFMFRLSAQETEALNRSHFATGSQKHRDPRFPPFAFTEHGAIMAATILNSPAPSR